VTSLKARRRSEANGRSGYLLGFTCHQPEADFVLWSRTGGCWIDRDRGCDRRQHLDRPEDQGRARRAPLQSAGSSAASNERSSRDWSAMRDVLHWEK